MIIPLPNTTTREISKKLVEAQEHYTLTTGRVLTLIVAAREDDDLENILASVRDASHEHPSRRPERATGARGRHRARRTGCFPDHRPRGPPRLG